MPTTDPNNPNSQYDFIMKGDQSGAPQPQRSVTGKFFLPKKTIFIIAGSVTVLLIGLIIISSLGKSTSNVDQLLAASGTAGDAATTSSLVNSKTKDTNALSLSATASATLASEQIQLNGVLASSSVKYDKKKLAIYTDKTIVAKLTAAEQNDTLEAAYYSYLKEKLEYIQARLLILAKDPSEKLKPIVLSSYESNKKLLTSPQLR